MKNSDQNGDQTRRAFIKTATYVVPAILTLKAKPAFASQGSEWPKGDDGSGGGGDHGGGSEGGGGGSHGGDDEGGGGNRGGGRRRDD